MVENLQQKLWDEDCTRLVHNDQQVEIPPVLRPLVSQKDVYEEAMRVSTAAVGLAGKSLAVLLEDRELQRAAGYDDNDVRLARASLANNFSGRDRRRPNLPEICRVDLILTNRGDL